MMRAKRRSTSAVYIYLRSSYGGRSAYGRVLRIYGRGARFDLFFGLNPDLREIGIRFQIY
jgi:hypothetical protein